MRLLHAAACVGLSCAATVAQDVGLRLAPAADADVDQNNRTVNNGTSPNLDFGKHYRSTPSFTVWFKRGYVKFDFSSLPAGAQPSKAELFWYQERSRTVPAGCLPVELYRVTQPWTETGVTWANKPAHHPTARATASVGGWNCSGWKVFDVTELVTSWIGGAPNEGMVITDPGERTAGAARPGMGYSREGPANRRPYLLLRFDESYGTGCGPAAAPRLAMTSGTLATGSSFTLTGQTFGPPATVLLVLGISSQTWAGVSLPFMLSGLGVGPGCNLLASAESVSALGVTTTGSSSRTLRIPRQARLRGAQLFAQMIAVDSQAQFYATNGLRLTIR